MVFPSVPLFLDPSNWHQPPNDETQRAPQQQAMPVEAASAATSSMSEVARVAKIPATESQLKCPRCDSSNTKFCYFNNYSLTQPRHFCKTCRRYWTRGGSLRNVPVGGGCRRNKRKRSSARRPRSPTAANPAHQQPPHPALSELMAPPTTQPYSFMASLHSLMSSQVGMGSFVGGNNNNNNNNNNSQPHYELPNLLGGGFGASFPFQNSNSNSNMEGMMETASFGKGFLGVPHHLQPPVKMEETAAARMNLLSKQFATDEVGVSPHQHPLFWNGINSTSINHAGLWTDLSGICPPNTIMR